MTEITILPISEIVPGQNDRTVFDAVKLAELADSIREHGLVQPITVRQLDGCELYEIVAGERRFRACSLLEWTEIPAIIQDLTDEEAAAIMLSENVARADLDAIDEGLAYQKRIKAYGWTAQDCADKAGVSVVRVQFRLKLLKLRSDLQELVRSGNLDIGYAQIIVSSGLDANFQLLATRALQENASPTPPWFRRLCGELARRQSQVKMFDDPLFSGLPGVIPQPVETIEPPHPTTTKPPKHGNSPKEIIESQMAFWNTAAEAWDRIGKPFRRQECQAAALALQGLL